MRSYKTANNGLFVLTSALSTKENNLVEKQIDLVRSSVQEYINGNTDDNQVTPTKDFDRQIFDFVQHLEAAGSESTHEQSPSSDAQHSSNKRGRKAIGLNDFKSIAAVQINKLQVRMAALGDHRTKEWQSLRK